MKKKIVLLMTLCSILTYGVTAQSTANTAYGSGAGPIGGNSNATFGGMAGRVTTGVGNAFLGTNAGYFNTGGNNNVFVGTRSGWFNTVGSNNTNIGDGSAYFNTTGSNNTAIGSGALFKNAGGLNNTALGNGAGYNALGWGNVFLGFNEGVSETGSNKLYIANSGTLTPLIYGDFSSGLVGIGTIHPDFALTVNGRIKAEEVRVVVDVPADYVFEKDYKRMPLVELEKYVLENKHLPGVPNAATIKQDGWNVGEMNNKVLEKVEELTLYIIELKKLNDELRNRIQLLETKEK